VENEDALNAGHCVEPLREMQLCAVAAGASTVRRAAHLKLSRCLFSFGRWVRLEVDVDIIIERSSG
jgi:hypothetical protein